MAESEAERTLATYLTAVGGEVAAFERQHHYVPGRKYAADFAWPAHRLLVEVQGGIYNGKAHGSVQGILADIARGNEAALNGWRMLRVLASDCTERKAGKIVDLIEKALAQ